MPSGHPSNSAEDSYVFSTPLNHRNDLCQYHLQTAISLNYSFLAALLLAKKALLILSLTAPCAEVLSHSVSCRLQEFPLVFGYIHSAVLPLFMAAHVIVGGMFSSLGKGSDGNGVMSRHWTSICSIQQAAVLVGCMGLASLFTAHDSTGGQAPHLLVGCHILTAIHHKGTAFWLLTLLIALHSTGVLLWEMWIRVDNGPHRHSFLKSTRRVLFWESFAWLLCLLVTGSLLAHEFLWQWGVSARGGRALATALEVGFVLTPTLIGFGHAVAVLWSVREVRVSAIKLVPSMARVLPVSEEAVSISMAV